MKNLKLYVWNKWILRTLILAQVHLIVYNKNDFPISFALYHIISSSSIFHREMSRLRLESCGAQQQSFKKSCSWLQVILNYKMQNIKQTATAVVVNFVS